jgi:hypothetical protein
VAGFLFKLETTSGEAAEPPTLSAAVPNWSPGDCIYLGPRTLRVVGKRDDDADSPPVLVVVDTRSGRADGRWSAKSMSPARRPAAEEVPS